MTIKKGLKHFPKTIERSAVAYIPSNRDPYLLLWPYCWSNIKEWVIT